MLKLDFLIFTLFSFQEFEEQIKNKERCIDKMKEELATLRKKRKECDSDFAKLTKRIHSCENAMKALPNL